MNCRGIMIIVVAGAGLQAGLTSPARQAAAVVVALVTTAMTGPLLTVLAARIVRADRLDEGFAPLPASVERVPYASAPLASPEPPVLRRRRALGQA